MTHNSERKLAPNPSHARHVTADLIYLTQQFGLYR